MGSEASGYLYTLGLFFPLPADRMHPFLAIYDLKALKAHPLVFAPGVPVIAQVVGTERYTSGSKVSHQLIQGRWERESWPRWRAGLGQRHTSDFHTRRWEPVLYILFD